MSSERFRSGYHWLTPDDLPEDRPILRGVYLPAEPSILAAVSGALEPLTYPENWEEFGSETAEDTAEYFRGLFEEFLEGIEDPGGGGSVPIGAVVTWFKNTAPTGWLFCTGQTLNKADYPDLYDAMPSGLILSATQFQLPNYANTVELQSAQSETYQGKASGYKLYFGTYSSYMWCRKIIRAE